MSDDNLSEEWRPVVGYEGLYEVSSLGRVKSLPRHTPTGMRGGKILTPVAGPRNGLLRVQLCRANCISSRGVHRLVLEAFVSPCPPSMEACHNNGRPSDNTVENLRWDTHANNMLDMIAHGTVTRGETNGTAKLTATSVRKAYELRASGMKCKEIAKIIGISASHTATVLRRGCWRHLEVE